MKKMNVIQIKGVRGLILAGFVVCCLIAGFIAFPGLVSMYLWNYLASFNTSIPSIGLFQGVLLWGILLASYFIFRKERVIVCMKSPQTLSDEELKSIFANVKKQSLEDPILQAMLKAREAELKYKAQEKQQSEQDAVANSDSKL